MHTRIFIACFLGAVIGTLVALQMHETLWWIGMILGAGVGYLSYEFKAVLAAIPRAYEAARGWHPDSVFWKIKTRNMGVFLGLTQTILVGLLLVYANALSEAVDWKTVMLMTIFAHAMMGIMGFTMPVRDSRGEVIYVPLSYGELNPLTVYLWHLPRGIFFAIRWIIVGLPQTLAFSLSVAGSLRRFSVFLFREIHSDARLLCACDAAIGTVIGYFTGNAVIGGVVGGVVGVLNYEIVSKRILGLTAR